MKLEFLLCGSPTDRFFSQMAFFRLCLDALGGDEARARLVCTFGDHTVEEIPDRWKPWFDRIEVHWAHAPGAENPLHRLQHNVRFDLLDPKADLSVLCDADVAVMAPVTPLAQMLQDRPALAGVIAHFHFPWEGREMDPARDWPELARAVLGYEIPTPYRYTLLGPEARPESPFYINYGVFAGPPDLMTQFGLRDDEIRLRVVELLSEQWAAQVAVPLTCADLGLPVQELPMRYNFPNDYRADAFYPQEMEKIVFMHYLRGSHFSRARIFAEAEAFQQFLELDLKGSNARFQRFVAGLTGGRYPFAA